MQGGEARLVVIKYSDCGNCPDDAVIRVEPVLSTTTNISLLITVNMFGNFLPTAPGYLGIDEIISFCKYQYQIRLMIFNTVFIIRFIKDVSNQESFLTKSFLKKY